MKVSKAQLIKIIFDKFGESYGLTLEDVCKSVWTKDPHQWTNGADYTISTEDGLPSPVYSSHAMDLWIEVQTMVGACIEPVNGGVLGVYGDEDND